jgi:ketosteroid isomerase-like protein
MGEHPNLVVAQSPWDAVARSDAAALRELMSEKTVWRMPGALRRARRPRHPAEALGGAPGPEALPRIAPEEGEEGEKDAR